MLQNRISSACFLDWFGNILVWKVSSLNSQIGHGQAKESHKQYWGRQAMVATKWLSALNPFLQSCVCTPLLEQILCPNAHTYMHKHTSTSLHAWLHDFLCLSPFVWASLPFADLILNTLIPTTTYIHTYMHESIFIFK